MREKLRDLRGEMFQYDHTFVDVLIKSFVLVASGLLVLGVLSVLVALLLSPHWWAGVIVLGTIIAWLGLAVYAYVTEVLPYEK